MNTTTQKMGISGRIAALFLQAQITPLLALLAFLLGVFAVLVTPREEEPQINVTMANVLIPFPGASVADVEQMVATPAEQLLSGMEGTEHVMSVSRPGLAVLTVQFKVGVPRTEALVRLHDQLRSHADFVPEGLGVLQPLIRPKGIDDVPIVSFTLHGKDADASAFDLERVAHSVEAELQRVPGTREVRSIGGPGRAVLVRLQPERMAGTGMTVPELRAALQSANLGLPVGDLLAGEKTIALEAGPFLSSADEVADLVVGTRGGRPVFLKDVAEVRDGPPPAQRMVWLGKPGKQGPEEFPAVTLQITKKPGENAIDVANALAARMAQRGLGDQLWCEQLSPVPSEAIAQAEAQIAHCLKNGAQPALAGSSLGGFYVTHLAEKHELRTVVINPFVPHDAFDQSLFIGEHEMLYSGERFRFTETHAAQIAAMDTPALTRPQDFWLLAEEGDETVRPYADYIFELPTTSTLFQPLLSTIPLQVFAASVARERGYDVDKPRNLAKSVTVE